MFVQIEVLSWPVAALCSEGGVDDFTGAALVEFYLLKDLFQCLGRGVAERAGFQIPDP